MAYSRYNPLSDIHYIADAVADLSTIPHPAMGDTCYVIESGMKYICNSKQKWLAQRAISSENQAEILKNYYTKAEIEEKIPRITPMTSNEILSITLQ